MRKLRKIIQEEIKNLFESTKHDKYCAILIDIDSQKDLIESTKEFYLKGWESALSPDGLEKYAHHMSISYEHNLDDIGLIENEPFEIIVTHIGISDLAIAAKVKKPIEMMTITPHISLATNRESGGSRMSSNDIENWYSISPIKLKGILKNDA